MLAIIQARMSSRRLPGKVLKPLAGVPMIQRVADRVAAAPGIAKVVLATSRDASDDAVADYCAKAGITCHRGPLDDVSARFIQAAHAEGAPAFVRITGDSPLMDPALVGQAVTLYEEGDWDLVSNVLVRSFPIGQSVEVLRLSTFEAVQARISDPAHRALPALARAAIKPNGQIDLAAVLRGIVRNPAILHALVSTGIDFNRALRSLRGCRDYLIGTELIESEALVSKAA